MWHRSTYWQFPSPPWPFRHESDTSDASFFPPFSPRLPALHSLARLASAKIRERRQADRAGSKREHRALLRPAKLRIPALELTFRTSPLSMCLHAQNGRLLRVREL